MPYLDPNGVSCNCAKSSKQEKVLLSCAAVSHLQRLSLSHINDHDGLEEGGEEAELADEDPEDINKESAPVQLSFEPMNRRDENVIVVHASPYDSWKPIGYIRGLKVAKVTKAIKNMEIANISINSIK